MSITKGIGFNRNILLPWLDAAAAICLETDDEKELRQRLQPIVAEDVNSPTNLRKTIAILVNIWQRTGKTEPLLRQAALDYYRTTVQLEDRLWLHYGMVMLAYSFFYQCTAVIGQLSRYDDPISVALIRKQLIAEIGQLGSLSEAVNRAVYSLREWNILVQGAERNTYLAKRNAFVANEPQLETWLLACGLKWNVATESPLADLVRMPALFPFQFSLTLDDIRQASWFEVERQGSGINMVRLNEQI